MCGFENVMGTFFHDLSDDEDGACAVCLSRACICCCCWPVELYMCCRSCVRRKMRTQPNRGDIVLPLPKTRPRNLSLSYSSSVATPASGCSDLRLPQQPARYGLENLRKRPVLETQESALFFRLSIELRTMIYRATLGEWEISLVQLPPKKWTESDRYRRWPASRYGRMGHAKAKYFPDDQLPVQTTHPGIAKYIRVPRTGDPSLFSNPPGEGLLMLLRTCRRIYVEAIDLLYSANRFHFFSPRDFSTFHRTILPQRADAITAIQLDYTADWGAPQACQVCSIISSMKSLKTVGITLAVHQSYPPYGEDVSWVLDVLAFLRKDLHVTVNLRGSKERLLARMESDSRPNLRRPNLRIIELSETELPKTA